MSKQENFISEGSANWKTIKFVTLLTVWGAIVGVTSWHFAIEHERLSNYEIHSHDRTTQISKNEVPDLSQPEQSKTFANATGVVKGGK